VIRTLGFAAAVLLAGAWTQDPVIRVALEYRAPGFGPGPNFSPIGTQVPLTLVTSSTPLPTGAVHPAKTGTLRVGPGREAWVPVLVAATAEFPRDLCQLFVDRNRNGRFDDDGPAAAVKPSQNEKTKAWWSSIGNVALSIPYGAGSPEPYMVSVWLVRDDEAPAPDILRYSVRSWRYATATVGGVDALVAAMDANNDAIFDARDKWSVLQASAPDAARAVLSSAEARPTNRLMFLPAGGRELVLEFRSFSPDGRTLELAVVDRPVTKAEDRAPDDMLAPERVRPRTTAPFRWEKDYPSAVAAAKISGRKVFIDFETSWCGPCKTMDEWIWTDVEVARQLNAGFVGVKLDGDIEKALVRQYKVAGYPTMIVLDPAGAELHRAVGYLSSKDMLAFLAR
jgi:thiol-disulfide isomerase/thioredoxin